MLKMFHITASLFIAIFLFSPCARAEVDIRMKCMGVSGNVGVGAEILQCDAINHHNLFFRVVVLKAGFAGQISGGRYWGRCQSKGDTIEGVYYGFSASVTPAAGGGGWTARNGSQTCTFGNVGGGVGFDFSGIRVRVQPGP